MDCVQKGLTTIVKLWMSRMITSIEPFNTNCTTVTNFTTGITANKQYLCKKNFFLFIIAEGLQEVKIKIENSVIKGYHDYKIASPIELPLIKAINTTICKYS